jgi:cell division topological specificity factor
VLAKLKHIIFGSSSGSSSDSRLSKSVAKSRLHFVLVQDRTGLTNEEMATFKEEMIAVIEKYFAIDKKAFDIAYKRDSDTTTLLINSPVVVKRITGKSNSPIKKKATKEGNAKEDLKEDATTAPA